MRLQDSCGGSAKSAGDVVLHPLQFTAPIFLCPIHLRPFALRHLPSFRLGVGGGWYVEVGVDLALPRRVFRQMLRVTRTPHPHPRNGCGPCQGRRRIGRCFTSFGTVMESFDAIVIGAGVIGCSVAYHLARLGSKKVLVLERTQIGAGTSAQSSGILRTHYSVIENVRLA